MSTSNAPTPKSRRDRSQPQPPPPPFRDPFDVDPDADADADAAPRGTWWERHAITVMATFSVVMLVFVITFQMAC